MSIIEKLKINIEAVTGLPFVYGAQGDVNRALDNTSMPCVFAYLIESGSVADDNGMLHERLTLALFFVDLTTFDFESISNESIIDACKRRAFKWRASNYTPDTFAIESVNSSTRVYDEIADAIVTGYALNVTIREMEGVGKCTEIDDDNEE